MRNNKIKVLPIDSLNTILPFPLNWVEDGKWYVDLSCTYTVTDVHDNEIHTMKKDFNDQSCCQGLGEPPGDFDFPIWLVTIVNKSNFIVLNTRNSLDNIHFQDEKEREDDLLLECLKMNTSRPKEKRLTNEQINKFLKQDLHIVMPTKATYIIKSEKYTINAAEYKNNKKYITDVIENYCNLMKESGFNCKFIGIDKEFRISFELEYTKYISYQHFLAGFSLIRYLIRSIGKGIADVAFKLRNEVPTASSFDILNIATMSIMDNEDWYDEETGTLYANQYSLPDNFKTIQNLSMNLPRSVNDSFGDLANNKKVAYQATLINTKMISYYKKLHWIVKKPYKRESPGYDFICYTDGKKTEMYTHDHLAEIAGVIRFLISKGRSNELFVNLMRH